MYKKNTFFCKFNSHFRFESNKNMVECTYFYFSPELKRSIGTRGVSY